MTRQPPRSTLFPSTTLFRSRSLRKASSAFARRSSPPRAGATASAARRIPRSSGLLRRFIGRNRLQRLLDESVAVLQPQVVRSEEHTSELQSRSDLVCRLLLE